MKPQKIRVNSLRTLSVAKNNVRTGGLILTGIQARKTKMLVVYKIYYLDRNQNIK